MKMTRSGEDAQNSATVSCHRSESHADMFQVAGGRYADICWGNLERIFPCSFLILCGYDLEKEEVHGPTGCEQYHGSACSFWGKGLEVPTAGAVPETNHEEVHLV